MAEIASSYDVKPTTHSPLFSHSKSQSGIKPFAHSQWEPSKSPKHSHGFVAFFASFLQIPPFTQKSSSFVQRSTVSNWQKRPLYRYLFGCSAVVQSQWNCLFPYLSWYPDTQFALWKHPNTAPSLSGVLQLWKISWQFTPVYPGWHLQYAFSSFPIWQVPDPLHSKEHAGPCFLCSECSINVTESGALIPSVSSQCSPSNPSWHSHPGWYPSIWTVVLQAPPFVQNPTRFVLSSPPIEEASGSIHKDVEECSQNSPANLCLEFEALLQSHACFTFPPSPVTFTQVPPLIQLCSPLAQVSTSYSHWRPVYPSGQTQCS